MPPIGETSESAREASAIPPEDPSSDLQLTPKAIHFAHLEKVIDAHGALGSMLIVGVNSDGDADEEEEDEEEEEEEEEYTADQIAKLRHIVINSSRDGALKKAHAFVSCGQGDGVFCMFNTSDGNAVVFGIRKEVKKALKKNTLPERFDALFALTQGLKSFDFWMQDNECWSPGEELELAIKALGKAWRETLTNSDAALGIDTEFTRPGIEALLAQLSNDLEECEASQDYPLEWAP